jgi:hypothetical protein
MSTSDGRTEMGCTREPSAGRCAVRRDTHTLPLALSRDKPSTFGQSIIHLLQSPEECARVTAELWERGTRWKAERSKAGRSGGTEEGRAGPSSIAANQGGDLARGQRSQTEVLLRKDG